MKKMLIILFCLLMFSACTNTNSNKKYIKEKTFLTNTVDEDGEMVLLLNTEVNLTTVNQEYKDVLINKTKEIITNCHKLLDSHHYYLDEQGNRIVNIKVLNDSIDKGPIKVDKIIIDALKEAKVLMCLTKGYFNISLGELSDLYHDKFLPYDSTNVDPASDQIDSLLKGIIDYTDLDSYLIINEEESTVELNSKDESKFKIDLGSFSKGYILNRVYEDLIKYDTSFLLSAGSSSIIAYENENEEISWSVGVTNPNKINDTLLAVNIIDGSISSSGDYENYYFLDDGTRRHHILNPYTGYSENYYRSNTLIANDAGIVDALSTALFNVPNKEERIEIIKNVEDYFNINIDYCFIDKDMNLLMNNRFKTKLIDSYTSNEINNIEIE